MTARVRAAVCWMSYLFRIVWRAWTGQQGWIRAEEVRAGGIGCFVNALLCLNALAKEGQRLGALGFTRSMFG